MSTTAPALDVRLYLVTDPSFGDVERVVLAAVEGGVTCVQVRDKHAPVADVRDLLRRLRGLVEGSGVCVLGNDGVEGGHGVHVGLGDDHPAAVRRRLGPDAVVGWSIERLDQLDDDVAVAACDYLAASPVHATPTKTDAAPALGLAGVRALAERTAGRLPIVGIGGVDAGNAEAVVRAGADGVAVVRAVGLAADPARAARELRERVDDALARRTDDGRREKEQVR